MEHSSAVSLPLAALLCAAAAAQSTTRISVSSSGLQGSGAGATAAISGNGRFVAFASAASDLVSGDTNGVVDIFVHDRWTGATERVSISSSSVEADADCLGPYVSEDGRHVAFRSDATTLVPGDLNGVSDVFLRDRTTDTTIRVSVDASGGDPEAWSYYATLSADVRFVCFQSEASDLVAGDANSAFDVFVRDLHAGTTERVSVDSSGAEAEIFAFSVEPAISADGRWVTFTSAAASFVPNDSNQRPDVFLHDRITGAIELVSISLGGGAAQGTSLVPSVSADGRFIAFASDAFDLVAGDTNGVVDVFVRDRLLGTTERISVGPGNAQANANSYLYYSHPAISADGRFVVFESYASELVAADGNGYLDVFVRDRATGTTELASVSSAGYQTHYGGSRGTISADGRFVAFETSDGHFVAGDTNDVLDVLLRDRLSGCAPVEATCTPKTNSLGCTPSIGASGDPHRYGPAAFFVTATGVRSRELGLLLWSLSPASTPFRGGVLCLRAPLVRTPRQLGGGIPGSADCSGTYSFSFDRTHMATHGLDAGMTVYAQWLSRDPGFAPPGNIGLTDALRFTVCP